jgi:hypothetical protein
MLTDLLELVGKEPRIYEHILVNISQHLTFKEHMKQTRLINTKFKKIVEAKI